VYVEYAPTNYFNLQAGKLATFAGQESTYTYQNINIQRGIIWNIETAVSRGVRGTFTGSKFSGGLEINDGYYSGNRLGVEGQITNTPSASITYEFVFVIPNSSAPANATASIANKRLYNPLLTYTTGKWQFQPYLLWVESPASKALGYANAEHAFGGVFMGTYSLSSTWSLPFRVEYGKNGSTRSDTSPNANLLGYGPGSSAWTYTLTPTYRKGVFFARAEASDVNVANLTPGTAFGTGGTQSNQVRTGLEAGLQF
jgi:Putative beta-barrel porin-2, OmpL-like. bbp2